MYMYMHKYINENMCTCIESAHVHHICTCTNTCTCRTCRRAPGQVMVCSLMTGDTLKVRTQGWVSVGEWMVAALGFHSLYKVGLHEVWTGTWY